MDEEQLTNEEVREIRACLEKPDDPDELMNKTCEILTEFTNSIGIVLSPPVSEIIMKHIEFVRLDNRRILVILVSQAGAVRQKVINSKEKLSQSDLGQAARYLVTHFSGMNLIQIRRELTKLVSQERAACDRLIRNAARLGAATLVFPNDSSVNTPGVYYGGTSRLSQNLDPAEMEKLTSLLAALEEKSRLVRIISEFVSNEASGPKVKIGLERDIPGMKNWTLIASPYTFDSYSSGSVGILGPSRMEYSRTISLVDSVARLFGQVLQTR
jgi:heat-inducible transcriptional repressor